MAKLRVQSDLTIVQEDEQLDSGLAAELAKLEKKAKNDGFKSLVGQIDAEFEIAQAFMQPKWDEWKVRLKLYNNQRKDTEAIGDPLLFSTTQTMLASLYNDQLQAIFSANEAGDVDVAENLTHMARFDHGKMEKDMLDYEWDFDSCFFGRGLMLSREFDRRFMVPVSEVLNPLLCLRDPRAKSVNGDYRGRGGSRFFGREMMLTKGEMRDASVFFNTTDLGKGVTSASDIVLDARSIRAEAQGYGDSEKIKSLIGENVEYRLLEWYTIWKNKRVLVTLADDRKKVVRYVEIAPLKGQRTGGIPVIDRVLYPMSHDWDGVSIPDLVEDKQRARATVQNLALKGVKSRLHPMYVYDATRIRNRTDLNFGLNKHIPVNGNTNGVIEPVRRDSISQEVEYITRVLDTAAQRATATPDQQQGTTSAQRRTATELVQVQQNVGTRFSLAARIFGWSEKRYWQQWYLLYKKNFKAEIDTKILRIVGALGTQFREFTKENIDATVDPDVTVESAVVAEGDRLQKLQKYQNFVGVVLSDPTSNKRNAIRQIGIYSGFSREDIMHILPQSVHEMKAEEENLMLDKNMLAKVDIDDDDAVHMEEHNKAADTPAKYAHIKAHKRAMYLKLKEPTLGQNQLAGAPQSQGAQPQPGLLQPVGAGGGAPALPAPQGGQPPANSTGLPPQ